MDRILTNVPRSLLLLISGLGVALVGLADYITGAEISFSIFYLLPIAIAAWYGGRRIGLVAAGVGCVVWLTADLLSSKDVSSLLVPFWNAVVRLAFFAVIAAMLTEIHRRLDYEERMARTDPLTGVLNGRAFRERLEGELARARRYSRPFTLIYMDADNFKQVNDQHGHQTGDRALSEIVDSLKGELRETDVIARLGGDEFAVLLIETGGPEAITVTPRPSSTASRKPLHAV